MLLLTLYVIGVLIGLAVMRDPWLPRTTTALLWPLGPAAFLIVVPILLIAAAILWPLYVLPTAVLVASLMWLAL